MDKFDINLEKSMSLVQEYALNLLWALVTLILGFIIVNYLVKVLRKALTKRDVSPTLIPFTVSITNVALKAMVIISAASILGIETTSFVAILGAAGLAVGFALQGSLSNFAGGVLIIVFKPFKVGDVIEAQGFIGIVHSIQIFNTILNTFDNKRIILPNGAISSGPITNYSAEDTRRVDMVFGIGYDDDIGKAKDILTELMNTDSRILKEPAEPFLAVKELGDSSVNFVMRVWAKAEDYWGIYFDMQENVKLTFDKEGISIPYPQTDVHLYNEDKK